MLNSNENVYGLYGKTSYIHFLYDQYIFRIHLRTLLYQILHNNKQCYKEFILYRINTYRRNN